MSTMAPSETFQETPSSDFCKGGMQEQQEIGEHSSPNDMRLVDDSTSSSSRDSGPQGYPLKRNDDVKGPMRSILKARIDEPIPICTRRNSYMTLPSPDLEHVKLKRVESLNSFLHMPAEPKRIDRRSRSVEFQDILVREYDLTIGDNPAVSFGPPISLDWQFEERPRVSVDQYELARPKRRGLRHMALSYYQRQNILVHTYGYSEEEVRDAKREAKKVKAQRAMTKAMLNFGKVEDFGESLGRKFGRVLGKKEKSSGKGVPRSHSLTLTDTTFSVTDSMRSRSSISSI